MLSQCMFYFSPLLLSLWLLKKYSYISFIVLLLLFSSGSGLAIVQHLCSSHIPPPPPWAVPWALEILNFWLVKFPSLGTKMMFILNNLIPQPQNIRKKNQLWKREKVTLEGPTCSFHCVKNNSYIYIIKPKNL